MALINSILQGTTPTLTVSIDSSDLSLSDVVQLELTFKQFNQNPIIHYIADCTLDLDANTVSYHFTEAETLAFDPTTPLLYQLRFGTNDGEIVGTNAMQVNVTDLMSGVVLPE